MTSSDYVIAGGGSAGCALAARLAEQRDVSVCLVEAGGRGRNLFIRMPSGNGYVFGNPPLDWGYNSVTKDGLNGRSVYFPRGKALGGSSIVNGMIYIRGVARDYDGWQQAGWRYADVLPYFRQSEGSRDRQDTWHGVEGPLKTDPAHNFGDMEKAFIEAAIVAGHRQITDFNGPERCGVAHNDSTVSRGVRQSSAMYYLKTAPRNLTIRTGTNVTRIVIENGRAIDLETCAGELIRADRGVICCQGAFGTPHLLMLSGIGPADHLRAHGVPVVADLASGGAHLSDHPDVLMYWASDCLDLSHAKYQRLDQAVRPMGH